MILPDRVLKCMAPAERKRLGPAGTLQSEAAAKEAHRSEKEMQAKIQAFCDLKGWPCYRSRTDKKTTNKRGQPDFLICLPVTYRERDTFGGEVVHEYGAFVAIECKMPGRGKQSDPTPEQQAELELIVKAYGETLVARSAQEAIDWLLSLSAQ